VATRPAFDKPVSVEEYLSMVFEHDGLISAPACELVRRGGLQSGADALFLFLKDHFLQTRESGPISLQKITRPGAKIKAIAQCPVAYPSDGHLAFKSFWCSKNASFRVTAEIANRRMFAGDSA